MDFCGTMRRWGDSEASVSLGRIALQLLLRLVPSSATCAWSSSSGRLRSVESLATDVLAEGTDAGALAGLPPCPRRAEACDHMALPKRYMIKPSMITTKPHTSVGLIEERGDEPRESL